MKIALFLIMCSGVSGDCMPPHYFNTYTNYYDCFDAGYTESLKKTKEIGKEEINEHKIYIRFNCVEQPQEEKQTKEKVNA